MCHVAMHLLLLQRRKDAGSYYQRARKLGAAHGFFSVECQACQGLGQLAMVEGRHEEGVELLRHALSAAPFSENQPEGADSDLTGSTLHAMIDALFEVHKLDEVEPLVLRYREATRETAQRTGRVDCFGELHGCYISARLHQERGRLQEAEREVRALLDLLRENRARVQDMLGVCQPMLSEASGQLQILDPETGNQELIESWALELAKLRS